MNGPEVRTKQVSEWLQNRIGIFKYWINIQIRQYKEEKLVIMNTTSQYLDKVKFISEIDDISRVFSDGITLPILVEHLTQSSLSFKVSTNDHLNRYEKLGNLDLALNKIKKEGVKIINIGPSDILEGTSVNLILGLVWALMQRYQLHNTTKLEMMIWINQVFKTKNKPIIVKNLTTDFKDGQVVYKLVKCVMGADDDEPELYKQNIVTDYDIETAIKEAEVYLKVPQLLQVSHFKTCGKMDEKCLLLWLSYFPRSPTNCYTQNLKREGIEEERTQRRKKQEWYKYKAQHKQEEVKEATVSQLQSQHIFEKQLILQHQQSHQKQQKQELKLEQNRNQYSSQQSENANAYHYISSNEQDSEQQRSEPDSFVNDLSEIDLSTKIIYPFEQKKNPNLNVKEETIIQELNGLGERLRKLIAKPEEEQFESKGKTYGDTMNNIRFYVTCMEEAAVQHTKQRKFNQKFNDYFKDQIQQVKPNKNEETVMLVFTDVKYNEALALVQDQSIREEIQGARKRGVYLEKWLNINSNHSNWPEEQTTKQKHETSHLRKELKRKEEEQQLNKSTKETKQWKDKYEKLIGRCDNLFTEIQELQSERDALKQDFIMNRGGWNQYQHLVKKSPPTRNNTSPRRRRLFNTWNKSKTQF